MNPEINILNNTEIKKIFEKLNDNYGIELKSLPKNSKLIQRGKEKISIFTGEISDKDIQKLKQFASIELIGLYFAKIDLFDNNKKEDIRLNMEGTHIFKENITKNIINLSSENLIEEWMMGREILIPQGKWERGFVVIRNSITGDFLGCGKASAEKITNFIPKGRRLKERS